MTVSKAFAAAVLAVGLGASAMPTAHAEDAMMKKNSMAKHDSMAKKHGMKKHSMMKGDAMQKEEAPAQ